MLYNVQFTATLVSQPTCKFFYRIHAEATPRNPRIHTGQWVQGSHTLLAALNCIYSHVVSGSERDTKL
jgi:hypothetical protein